MMSRSMTMVSRKTFERWKSATFCFHRIHVSKIIYVSELLELPSPSTVGESAERWREKWSWAIKGQNLTPEYGRHWKCSERTFTLANQFNELHPDQPVNIRRLNYGSPVKVSRRFAEYILDRIMELDPSKCMKEEAFISWLLKHRGVGTVASRLSNCRVVERREGDLDEHFERDRLTTLVERLTYTKDDAQVLRFFASKLYRFRNESSVRLSKNVRDF